MDAVISMVRSLFYGIQFFLLFFMFYWIAIGFFGFGKAKPMEKFPPSKRFLFMIPAHNEENVIRQLLRNLKFIDYPRDLYDILVISDNSIDKTAEISREEGAIVLEHQSKPGELKGKPYAIKYALDELGEDLTDKYDGLVILDADNLVSKNFLTEMNNHLMKGHRLIQAYLDTKNPDDNWITMSYATSYYYMNRSWQLAKSRLGLGNAIGGTGFCVDTKLIKEIGWTARSLTEDLEFQIQCLLKGVPAKWSHHARIYDEKPNDFWASCVQRLRWARGHWDVCFKYAPKLLWRLFSKGDLLSFDGLMYLINPGRIVITSLSAGMAILASFANVPWFDSVLPWYVWFLFLLYQLWYVGYALTIDVAKPLKRVLAIISLSIFNYTYIPLFMWALVTKRNKTWKRTEHTRAIEFNELEKVK